MSIGTNLCYGEKEIKFRHWTSRSLFRMTILKCQICTLLTSDFLFSGTVFYTCQTQSHWCDWRNPFFHTHVRRHMQVPCLEWNVFCFLDPDIFAQQWRFNNMIKEEFVILDKKGWGRNSDTVQESRILMNDSHFVVPNPNVLEVLWNL